MIAFILLVIIIIISFVKLTQRRTKEALRLPPGPVELPVIGTLYCHSTWPESFRALQKRFGDIITVYIGPKRIIMLSSHRAIKQALVDKSDKFSNRGLANSRMFRAINPNLRGVVDSEFSGELMLMRNKSLQILRNLGVGRSVMQEQILDQARELVDYFKHYESSPMYPKLDIQCAILNIVLRVLLNVKLTRCDADFKKLIQSINGYFSAGSDIFLLDHLPFLRYVYPFKRSYQAFIEGNNHILDFASRTVEERIENYIPGRQADYIDYFLETCCGDHGKLNVDTENLKYTLRDLLVAGMETTATALQWVLIQLANYPAHQAQIQGQLDSIFGKEQAVKQTDKLPLLEAFLLETQRYHTMVPLAPRHTYERTIIDGFDIPANTTVLLSMHGVHMDERTWGDPHVFRPERFIDEKGLFHRHPNVITFSMGKRQCLGELLAKQDLFILTATLLQNFTFRPPEGNIKISDAANLGGTFAPKPFHILAIPR